jgi:membrane protein YdbS with pleckstrin-like domain
MYEPLKRLAAAILRVDVQPPALPAGSRESAHTFRASPRYLSYRLIFFWVGVFIELAAFIPSIVAVTVAGHPIVATAVIGGAALAAAGTFLGYCAVRLDYELRYYVVTDRAIRIREGAWLTREMTLTHANVQDLSIQQGPVQRLFGIADVVIKTAGGGAVAAQPGGHGHLAMLAGVEDAPAVRDRIRAYLRRKDDGGLGDDDGAKASPSMLEALREVAEAARALRAAAERRA